MTNLLLHRFASKDGRPDFNTETVDSTQRNYIWSIDVDRVDSKGVSFRDRINSISKLNALQVNLTHLEMQKTGLEVWDYCPECIVTIKSELGL